MRDAPYGGGDMLYKLDDVVSHDSGGAAERQLVNELPKYRHKPKRELP
jgi:hypothetical protein